MSQFIYLSTTQNTSKCIFVCDALHCVTIAYGLCTRAMLVRTTKHEDVDYGALSAHLFRCMFSRIPSVTISGFGGTSFVDQSCYFSLLFVMLSCASVY